MKGKQSTPIQKTGALEQPEFGSIFPSRYSCDSMLCLGNKAQTELELNPSRRNLCAKHPPLALHRQYAEDCGFIAKKFSL
jgi:hypothetical protein